VPFLDPVTRDKMRFNPDLFDLVPRSQLDADFGGDYEFEFEFETYWKQIVDHCGIAPDGTRLPGYFDGPISTGNDACDALVEEKVPCDDGAVEGVVVGG